MWDLVSYFPTTCNVDVVMTCKSTSAVKTCVKLCRLKMIRRYLSYWQTNTRGKKLFKWSTAILITMRLNPILFCKNYDPVCSIFIKTTVMLYISQEAWNIPEHKSFSGTWWRHQMETFSGLLAICEGNSPVPGEFPAQRPVTRSFDVFFDLRVNKRLSKQSWGWWFKTLSRPWWRHNNDLKPFIAVDKDPANFVPTTMVMTNFARYIQILAPERFA